MSRVSGYNHINTIADAKGYTDEERKAALEKEADIEKDSFVPMVFKEEKTDKLDISEEYKIKKERTLDELMDMVKTSEVSMKYDKHKVISDYLNEKLNSNIKSKDFMTEEDKEKMSVVEKMREALEENEDKQMDIVAIAKKIARGRKCSKKELEFLKKTDEVKYRKALAANEARKMTETRLKTIRDKDQLKRAISSAKASAMGVSDTEFTMLITEGVKELEERYIQKKKKHDNVEDSQEIFNENVSFVSKA